ncbi:MFS multidrug transporter [Mycena indigotica]|uniref:MFS multidrug transporter n=1 Tax=Mycena indigotica TaxID=2126181 RepID=A0A8H6VWU2_9AGAR|nr:MFS multidrug transporter [Mycena indigotica]KAF7296969.1 MFS multidrug transporter [Mycena indigotica]
MPHEDSASETSRLLPSEASTQYGMTDTESAAQKAGEEKTTAALLSVLLPMGIGVFFCAMDQTIVVSSYAAIGNELEQLQMTSWIATAYMLTLTSFQPLYGKMSDIFGRKACLLFAYTVFAFGTLCCGLARTMPELN